MKYCIKILIIVVLCHINMWCIMKAFGTRHVYGTVSSVGSYAKDWYGSNGNDITLDYPDGGSEKFFNGTTLFFGKDKEDYESDAAVLKEGKDVCIVVNGFGNILHASDLSKPAQEVTHE